MGEVEKFVILWCEISCAFHVPKILMELLTN